MEAEGAEEDIEALIDGMAYIPGHFHLELHLNGEPSGPEELRHRDVRIKRDSLRPELEAETGGLQYAVRNLLGLLAFHLEELEEAEEVFRSVSQEDPGNLNAWANLGFVYERLGREQDEGACMERLSQLMGLQAGESLQESSRLRAARCLAEQAYTQPYDVELDREEELKERMSTALTLYNRALDYGGDLIPVEEKRSWFFKMATIYIRLDSIVRDGKDMEYNRLSHYNKALTLLTETLKSDNTHLKALAWCYVGLMLERKEEFPTVPMAVHDCGYSGSDPLSCYGSAIKLATDDAFILNRLAKVFFLSGKLEMATGVSNMALNVLPDSELNWQAYCTRAEINLTTYVRDLEKAKLNLGGIPDRQHLRDAKADLERVVAVRPCLKTHLELGQVYYYMGVDALQESLLVDEDSVNQALVSLAHAMQCPLGATLPKVHLLRGRCLLLKAEEQNAAVCFQKAMGLERPGEPQGGAGEAFRCLLQALLVCFTQGGDPEAVTRLEECVRQAEERYAGGVVRAELRALSRSNAEEVTELCKVLVQRGRLELVRKLLESLKPPGRNPLLGRSFSV